MGDTKRRVEEALKRLTDDDKKQIIAMMQEPRMHPWLVEDVAQTLEIGLRLYFDVFCAGCREPLVATWNTQEYRDVPAFDLEVRPCKNCSD